MILLGRSEEFKITSVTFSKKLCRKPCEQLFRLQGVNKTFRAVIARNSELQKRMFLDKYPAGTNEPNLPYWSPFAWMKSRIVVWGETRVLMGYEPHWHIDLTITCRRTMGENIFPPMSKAKRERADKWLRPEASWRKMMVYCTKDKEIKKITCFSENHTRGMPYHLEVDVNLGQLADWMKRVWECPNHVTEVEELLEDELFEHERAELGFD